MRQELFINIPRGKKWAAPSYQQPIDKFHINFTNIVELRNIWSSDYRNPQISVYKYTYSQKF